MCVQQKFYGKLLAFQVAFELFFFLLFVAPRVNDDGFTAFIREYVGVFGKGVECE
jgi:hypothetical protein